MGAVLFSELIGNTLMMNNSGVGHGSSHNGNPVASASALATMDFILEEKLLTSSIDKGNYLVSKLSVLKTISCFKEIRHKGLMIGLILQQEEGIPINGVQISLIYSLLLDEGVMVYPGVSGFILMPALTLNVTEIDIVSDKIVKVISTIRLTNGKVYKR